jgi:hypothetical protein
LVYFEGIDENLQLISSETKNGYVQYPAIMEAHYCGKPNQGV